MNYSKLTRVQKKQLEKEYKELFGEQVLYMRQLFETKTDDILLEELLTNVSGVLFQIIKSNNFDKSEFLLERMRLSVLEYDVLIIGEPEFEEHQLNVYFFNNYQIVEFTNMRVRNHEDVKTIILMIMHIGNQYDQLSKSNPDVDKHLDEYRLLDGFNKNFKFEVNTGQAGKETIN